MIEWSGWSEERSWAIEAALWDSEDSVKLNTSFVERLNLTIRQGSRIWVDERPMPPRPSNSLFAMKRWDDFCFTPLAVAGIVAEELRFFSFFLPGPQGCMAFG
jgi:hypothetical protein